MILFCVNFLCGLNEFKYFGCRHLKQGSIWAYFEVFNPIWHGGGGYVSPEQFKFLIAAYSALKCVDTFDDVSDLCIYQLLEQKKIFFEGLTPLGSL